MKQGTFTDLHPTKAIVYVSNKKLDFSFLRLEQAYGEHHSFCIKADIDALGELIMNNSKDYSELLGQTIYIDIQQGNDNENAYRFRNIIQDIAVEKEQEKHEYLMIKGSSPTILMENGKHYNVFAYLTPKQVVRQLTEDIINYQTALPVVNNPVYKGNVEFLMQYDESDWQFLRRLCCIVEENLYWTGQELVFGGHKDFSASEVTYGRELTCLQFSGRYLPNHFQHYQRLPESYAILKKNAPDKVKGTNNSVNKMELDKSNIAYDTIYISGTSKTAHPRIGHLLKINKPNTTCEAADMGTFRITKVTHVFDRNNHYKCQFEGIQADLKYYPFLDVKIPVTEPISVQIISNADPEGRGRIKVKFPFDAGSVSDAWLSVMIPYTRFADGKKKDKTVDFIPEAGDQIMVNFMFGDPNLPYAIANMFHKENEKVGIENTSTSTPVSQKDYEEILKFRDKLYDRLEAIAKAIEIIKKDYNIEQQRIFLRTILECLLLVTQTKKGKKMFFDILEYVKTFDPDLSNEYWKIYDEQIDTILGHEYVK